MVEENIEREEDSIREDSSVKKGAGCLTLFAVASGMSLVGILLHKGSSEGLEPIMFPILAMCFIFFVGFPLYLEDKRKEGISPFRATGLLFSKLYYRIFHKRE